MCAHVNAHVDANLWYHVHVSSPVCAVLLSLIQDGDTGDVTKDILHKYSAEFEAIEAGGVFLSIPIEDANIVIDVDAEFLFDSDWVCRAGALQNVLGHRSSWWTAELFIYADGKVCFPKYSALQNITSLPFKHAQYVSGLVNQHGKNFQKWAEHNVASFRSFVPLWLWKQQVDRFTTPAAETW